MQCSNALPSCLVSTVRGQSNLGYGGLVEHQLRRLVAAQRHGAVEHIRGACRPRSNHDGAREGSREGGREAGRRAGERSEDAKERERGRRKRREREKGRKRRERERGRKRRERERGRKRREREKGRKIGRSAYRKVLR